MLAGGNAYIFTLCKVLTTHKQTFNAFSMLIKHVISKSITGTLENIYNNDITNMQKLSLSMIQSMY